MRSTSDPLLFLDFHRHFSHSLIFAPIGAAIATALMWPLLGRRLPLKRLYLYALLGYGFAGLLDACTSYGTHLLWPFTERPVAWSIISIVDPLFTVCLLVGVVAGMMRRTSTGARSALALAVLYLGLGGLQHWRVEQNVLALAAEREHPVERVIAKPSIGNLIVWRGLYVSDGVIYADAVRVALSTRVYPGESRPLLSTERAATERPRITARDIARFATFADGLLVSHPERPRMIGDARFAMLPNRLRPLWGIEPTPAGEEPTLRFVTDRSLSDRERTEFRSMLFGQRLD